MTKKPAVQAHIYMPAWMRAALERAARKEHRSVNLQILHYVSLGLENDGESS